MFGIDELKDFNINNRDRMVLCPVKGCRTKVEKMKGVEQKRIDSLLAKTDYDGLKEYDERFLCKNHNIYISPTTFIYKYLKDILLWNGNDEVFLRDKIFPVKRYNYQFFHHNSEDATSWNVFRFLEENKLLSDYLTNIVGFPVREPEIIYWSYSQSQKGKWKELINSMRYFREILQRSSEPDLIIKCNSTLFFIESKIAASNKVDFDKNHTVDDKKERITRYSIGSRFLKQPIENIINGGYYQLMRFWLIGSWIAEKNNLDFYLLNIVRKDDDKYIESEFGKYLALNEKRLFRRITWFNIYKYILNSSLPGENKEIMLNYFKNKTIGYDRAGRWQHAFSLQ